METNKTLIREIAITPLPNRKGHIGFVDFTLYNSIRISGCALYTSPSHPTGLRITFPRKDFKKGSFFPVKVFTKDLYECLILAISEQYREFVKEMAERNDKTERSFICSG